MNGDAGNINPLWTRTGPGLARVRLDDFWLFSSAVRADNWTNGLWAKPAGRQRSSLPAARTSTSEGGSRLARPLSQGRSGRAPRGGRPLPAARPPDRAPVRARQRADRRSDP